MEDQEMVSLKNIKGGRKNEIFASSQNVLLTPKKCVQLIKPKATGEYLLRFMGQEVYIDGKNHWTTKESVLEALVKMQTALWPFYVGKVKINIEG